ncbi:TetR/AcrR family transcriptional regulator [Streptomyces sp. UNOC14_S4]|uniref:TetR/AcrR family transcriptional regulator n=1 Tax=Streptomyces sp. UNOC14_S4 TaxID=2872340 RepID=UPI001E32FF41|nr:TetR/AcrR family transcriptional regulator [Streptomyces sp. UNOC14_S4]MCC3767045.1 TetR family transcriptional regulator [Streptomyces sp. UNOC14_S4]
MQERAARTRQALIHAAAGEFDRNGYAATSLARVSRAAGTSIGAVTFHFVSKEELADAVHAQGVAVTRHALRQVDRRAGPLRSAVAMTVAVVRCLEDDVAVRAAARLDHDRNGSATTWTAAWSAAVEDELIRAADTEPHGPADPSILLKLAVYLVHGAEADLRTRLRTSTRKPRAGAVSEVIARMWEAVLPATKRTEGA